MKSIKLECPHCGEESSYIMEKGEKIFDSTIIICDFCLKFYCIRESINSSVDINKELQKNEK